MEEEIETKKRSLENPEEEQNPPKKQKKTNVISGLVKKEKNELLSKVNLFYFNSVL
jgi:hypothetical protein